MLGDAAPSSGRPLCEGGGRSWVGSFSSHVGVGCPDRLARVQSDVPTSQPTALCLHTLAQCEPKRPFHPCSCESTLWVEPCPGEIC